jgi:hypothetical protein
VRLGTGLRSGLLFACVLGALPVPASAQRIPAEATAIVAPLAGRLATPAPGQVTSARFAPDLGLTDVHEGELRILFGDAIVLRDGEPISLVRDDVQGRISLADFPTGDAVDAYVAAHPPAEGQASWQYQGPPVFYQLTPLGRASAISLHDGGELGALLDTGLFKAPLAAFSNALGGEASGFFAIYARSVPLQCSGGDSPSCDQGFECEPRLGKIGGNALEDGAPCMLGARYCQAVAGGGLCVDPTSSLYQRELPAGLVQAVAWQHTVGNADPQKPERYYTRKWYTNKFTSLTARTVNDFDPERVAGEGNDYRPTDGTNPAASKVFLWGRAGYIGTRADGRDLHLYFAVADVPRYSASGEPEWAPRYFAGLSPEGAPQFSTQQVDAVPLDLNGSPRAVSETWDVVNQMSISWVESLGSWVMLYGGGANAGLADFFSAGLGDVVQHDPEGAIHVRFARQPWGPWTAPQQLFTPGNPIPLAEAPDAASQYAPGGILRHPMCVTSNCAPQEPTEDSSDYGFLYAANIIDAWTVPTANGARIYWNVSTWHPYQVVLMKSELAADLPPTADPGADADAPHQSPPVTAGSGAAPLPPQTDPSVMADDPSKPGDLGPPGAGAPQPATAEAEDGSVLASDGDAGCACGIARHGRGASAYPMAALLVLLSTRLTRKRSRNPDDEAAGAGR